MSTWKYSINERRSEGLIVDEHGFTVMRMTNHPYSRHFEERLRLMALALVMRETLEDVYEWLRDGKVDGVGFDIEGVTDVVKATLTAVRGGEA